MHIYIYTYYPIKIPLNIHQNPTRCCIPTSSRFCSFQRTSDHRATESDHGHASHWPGQLVWGKGCSTSWMVFLMEKKQKTNTKKKWMISEVSDGTSYYIKWIEINDTWGSPNRKWTGNGLGTGDPSRANQWWKWGVPGALKIQSTQQVSYIRGWFFATSVYVVGDCFF